MRDSRRTWRKVRFALFTQTGKMLMPIDCDKGKTGTQGKHRKNYTKYTFMNLIAKCVELLQCSDISQNDKKMSKYEQ